jgi:hypothetical protein
MLKYLAILCLLLAFAIPAVPLHNQPTGKRCSSQSSKDAQQPPPPAEAPVPDNQTAAYHQQESKEQPEGWHKFVAWPEGITAWLIMLTLVAIVWQAYETRKAAEATRESADATRVQAEISRKAFISQFRPKVSVRGMWFIEKDGALTIEIWLANTGGTTAHIIGSDIKASWEIPRELKKKLLATTALGDTSLRAGREHPISVDITEIAASHRVAMIAVEEQGRDQEAWICCFGHLTYLDDNKASRSTGFFRKYDIETKRFVPSSDPEDEYAD